MIIKSIKLHPFGCLKNYSLDLHEGYNHIALPNESGKSTIFEALSCGFFGYPKKSAYPYLPNLSEAASVSMELDLGQGDENPVVVRENTKKKLNSYIYLGALPKPIDDRSILAVIKAMMDEELFNDKLTRDDFFISSDAILEHRNFIERSKKSDIGFLASISSKTPDLDKLIAKKEKIKSEIYTNNSNSVSKIKKLSKEREALKLSIEEWTEAEQENRLLFKEYQQKASKLEALKRECSAIKSELSEAEREREKEYILNSYLMLEEEAREKNYDKLAEVPGLSGYELSLRELDNLKSGLNELEAEIEANRLTEDYAASLEIYEADNRASASGAAELYSILLKQKDYAQKISAEAQALESLGYFDEGLDTEKFASEREDYKKLHRDFEKIAEKSTGNKARYAFIVLPVILGLLIYFKDNAAVWGSLLVTGAVLFLGSLYLSAHSLRRLRNIESEKNMIKSEMDAEFNELKKTAVLKSIISEYKPLDSPADKFIDYTIAHHDIYHQCLASYRACQDEELNFYKAEPSLFFISAKALDDKIAVIKKYLEDKNLIASSLKREAELLKKIDESNKAIYELQNSLKNTEVLYSAMFSVSNPLDIRGLNEAKIRLDAASERLIKDAEKLGFDLRAELISYNKKADSSDLAVNELKRELEEKTADIAELEQAVIKLNSILSQAPSITHKKYRNYSLGELREEDIKLKEAEEELRRVYNKLGVEIVLLREMAHILKETMRPRFIERASNYLRKLAPDCRLRPELTPEATIAFVDENSLARLPFTNLSSGTKAQIIFCLKLAHLDEIDGEGFYPLIIDDAFMAYDYKRYRAGLELLEDISQKRQVIYFEAERATH